MLAASTHRVEPARLHTISTSIPKILIITGDEDHLVAPANSDHLARCMPEAEHALQESAVNIPAEVCARFETAAELNDEDRNTILEVARRSLARFQAGPESEIKPGSQTEVKPKPTAALEEKS